ncbi:trans-resveratrol di-O-methyltransferase-like [Dorcoceras hygrometricum]|uniref:Trans-resveratrol di-O-methyltransferase-like n=1 Tax=Dorcoceras hygrometricum TaxID=472368 RepID=A0A2Z7BL77_9LAMI|nr:trans-resveratrol di-O-methyltransferase-like [Dorcoceras hygrometricum]
MNRKTKQSELGEIVYLSHIGVKQVSDSRGLVESRSSRSWWLRDQVFVEGLLSSNLLVEPSEEEEGETDQHAPTVDKNISDDESMTLEEILLTITVDCPLPSTFGEITKIQLGQSISIPVVDEGDMYKASLPKIHPADKGKAPLQERDPVKGNPVKEQLLLIVADIELLVHLREQVIDEVDRFFNSFSLKNLANLKIEDIYEKEGQVLSWAETDSTRIALQRKMYILTKYIELLIRKFLEAHRLNFVSASLVFGFQRPTVTSWGWSQLCTAFVRYSLFSGLSTVDIRNFVSTLALNRSVLRDVQLVTHSVSVAPSVQTSIASVFAPDVQSITSSDFSSDSSLHFIANDISTEDDVALDQSILPSSAADISASLAALRESFSKLFANQTIDSQKSDDAHSEVLCKINHVERVFLDSLAAQNEAFRGLFKSSRQEAQNDNNALSLALKAVRTQNAILSTDLAATQKEVKDLKVALSKDFDDKLADIRNDLLEFRVETQEQLASLGAHLAELIAFITKGSDDKKGEGSSNRPQPPPDDQNRPIGGSGSRADDPSRSGGGIVSREGGNRGGDGRRRGDSSGSSKRRRSDSGDGSGGRINYGPYLPPKRDAEYWISEKTVLVLLFLLLVQIL